MFNSYVQLYNMVTARVFELEAILEPSKVELFNNKWIHEATAEGLPKSRNKNTKIARIVCNAPGFIYDISEPSQLWYHRGL